MRIMLYSQHVLGIGHFFRSMAIAGALERHEVLFVEGGEPLPGFIAPSHVRRFFLPPLMMDSDFKAMEARRGRPEEIKPKRRQLLWDAYRSFRPDVLITELFPFGRKQFRFELMPILEAIRGEGERVMVVCSLRDILVEKSDQAAYEKGVIEVLNEFFDLVLVHSDPRMTALSETFQRMDAITVPIQYTGFVVRQAPVRRSRTAGSIVIASSGGGKVGVDLLVSTLLAVRASSDPDLRLRVFLGPFLEATDREHLDRLAAGDGRIALLPFSGDFPGELAGGDVSVSMAGYNTCMDILGSRIKALVYPFPQNREQGIRAAKLERMGLLRVLPDLAPATVSSALSAYIEERAPPPSMDLDLDGARHTADLVEKYFVNL